MKEGFDWRIVYNMRKLRSKRFLTEKFILRSFSRRTSSPLGNFLPWENTTKVFFLLSVFKSNLKLNNIFHTPILSQISGGSVWGFPAHFPPWLRLNTRDSIDVEAPHPNRFTVYTALTSLACLCNVFFSSYKRNICEHLKKRNRRLNVIRKLFSLIRSQYISVSVC